MPSWGSFCKLSGPIEVRDSCQAVPDYKVPVIWGTFVRRLNRFVAEVYIEANVERVHVPSSGRMRELLIPGAKIALLPSSKAGRKTKHSVVFVETDIGLVSIDSHLPNRLVGEWLEKGRLKEFPEVAKVTPEVKFGTSRFDFYVTTPCGQGCLIEVKSVTLVQNGVGLFPDAPTLRGARHMRELAAARGKGISGCVIFVVQREDAVLFRPNDGQDPEFGDALREAKAAGVGVFAYRCRVWQTSANEIAMALDGEIPVALEV